MSAVKRFYFPNPLPPPAPSSSTEPCKKEVIPAASDVSDEIEWGDASSLQVSVVIAMPTQRQSCSRTSGEDMVPDPEWMALGEFCIGMMDIPLSECG